MELNATFVTGMDIPNEAKKLMDKLTSIEGMTENEERAYRFGVSEALRAVRTILNLDNQPVFHIEGHDCMEEFALDEVIEIIAEKWELL